jgi:hypothetical protein
MTIKLSPCKTFVFVKGVNTSPRMHLTIENKVKTWLSRRKMQFKGLSGLWVDVTSGYVGVIESKPSKSL